MVSRYGSVPEPNCRGPLREYAAAAELIRAEGGFPNLSLEKTADICYFQVMYRSAISTLDRLAGEAEVGDLVTQARAQVDAA